MDNEEVQTLLADFEAVWQRVSPPPEAAENTAEAEKPERLTAVRAARWFPEI